jgi:hypothetical protein
MPPERYLSLAPSLTKMNTGNGLSLGLGTTDRNGRDKGARRTAGKDVKGRRGDESLKRASPERR